MKLLLAACTFRFIALFLQILQKSHSVHTSATIMILAMQPCLMDRVISVSFTTTHYQYQHLRPQNMFYCKGRYWNQILLLMLLTVDPTLMRWVKTFLYLFHPERSSLSMHAGIKLPFNLILYMANLPYLQELLLQMALACITYSGSKRFITYSIRPVITNGVEGY